MRLTRRTTRSLLACGIGVAGLAASGAQAHATVYTAGVAGPAHTSDGPEHPSSNPARNIESVATSFDNTTGHWVTQVTFAGPASSATISRMSTSLVVPAGGGCDDNAGTGTLIVVGHTDPSLDAGQYRTYCRRASQTTSATQSFNSTAPS